MSLRDYFEAALTKGTNEHNTEVTKPGLSSSKSGEDAARHIKHVNASLEKMLAKQKKLANA